MYNKRKYVVTVDKFSIICQSCGSGKHTLMTFDFSRDPVAKTPVGLCLHDH